MAAAATFAVRLERKNVGGAGGIRARCSGPPPMQSTESSPEEKLSGKSRASGWPDPPKKS
jgi:hypothetical protein